jgi:hypothetical protein
MHPLRTRRITLAIAGLLVAGAPLLAGCSVINDVVHDVTGQDLPAGLAGGMTLPDDFPREVPLIDGDLVFAVSLPGDGGAKTWNVTIEVSGADAFDTIRAQLGDAGFEYQGLTDGESGSTGVFRTDELTVFVAVAAPSGDQWTANYTVTTVETGG